MKRLSLLLMAIFAIALSSCEQVAIESISPKPAMVDVAFVATADDTRVALDGNTATWEVGDRISVALVVNYFSAINAEMEIHSTSDISADGKSATFRGSIPAGDYYGVTALYPALSISSNEAILDREAVDNIFMKSNTSSNDAPVFTASADKVAEVPISFSHLMHKMDFALTTTNNDLEGNDIAIEISATSDGAAIGFPTKQSLNMRNGTTSDAESATSLIAYGSSPNFSTMLFPLNTTKNLEFTFGIYINGAKCYEVKKGSFSTFKMSAGKTTVVNLALSDDNKISDGGEIVIEPITLSASATTIKANGVESATLSVITESGEDVTAQSTIYINGTKLNGTKFTTVTAGTYTLYAERYGEVSNSLTITAEEVATTGKTIVFAEGVTLTSGWYDVNKMAQGNNGDVSMCWAAASSNMIQWWQDRYVAAGNTLPATAVNGVGTVHHSGSNFSRTYELALMDLYLTEWDHSPEDQYGYENSRGCHAVEGIPWYFEGINYGVTAAKGSQAIPLTDGGYWTNIWSNIYPHLYHGYNYMFNWYTGLYTGSFSANQGWDESCAEEYSVKTGNDSLVAFSNRVVELIDRGVTEMTISLRADGGLMHATTLWGYEIDNATGCITRLWITDSDDLETEPKEQLLNEYSVSSQEGLKFIVIKSSTVRYGTAYVSELQPLSGYGSAE